ncbi:type I-F CRISPR-associated protein Csy1 [Pontibacterium sp.]|uniref:type I-F CRISPR-associated protein Csy1 n=1 Tax=Pontibacterium sp. TaxID=2036026 RepID=UPI003515579D
MSYSPKGSGELRQLMEGFIQERLQSKLKKLTPDDPKYQKLQEQYQYDNWLADAARRVSQLQVVTHSLKAIHPDAKGTNLYAPPEQLHNHPFVGSHILQRDFNGDVVGNAAALDVYKFLRQEYNGTTLLNLALNGDVAFKAALSDDTEIAESLVHAFSSITEEKGETASHTRAKQLFWHSGDDCTDDSHYHLLAPLYATSLAHKVFQTINHARFSDESKSARAAYRDKMASDSPVHVYPELATQKLGGTKPQNISQLNSERGGNNYLLASLPPLWESREIRPPLNTSSAFFRFSSRPAVRTGLKELIRLLSADTKSTMHVREHRDKLLDQLIGELILYTHETRQLEPGWSSASECHLPDVQKQWLDPHHYQPELPSSESAVDTWPKEIADTFARWLNQKLKKSLQTGDPEHQYWQTQLQKTLNLLQEDLSYV